MIINKIKNNKMSANICNKINKIALIMIKFTQIFKKTSIKEFIKIF